MPREHVAEDGRIVLNISRQAVRRLAMRNDSVRFDGRFAGQSRPIAAPITAILAIYAKETGEGMMFGPDPAASAQDAQDARPQSTRPAPAQLPLEHPKPALKLVE